MTIPLLDISKIESSCSMNKGLITYLRLTDNCQLDCSHCFSGGQTGLTGFIDVDKTVDFFTRLSMSNMPDWTQFLLHGGEPFLAPTSLMFELHERLTPLFKNVIWACQTNLTYKLTDERIRVLEEVCDSSFGTSWDKNIRWATDKQLKLWEDNVRTLSGRDHNITVMVSMDKTVIQQDPEELMRYFHDLGINHIMFERLTKTGNALDNSDIFPTNKELDTYIHKMAQAYWNTDIHKKVRNTFLDEIKDTVLMNKPAGVNCRECEQKILTVRADGVIAGCPDAASSRNYGTLDDSVDTVLNSSQRMKAITHEINVNPNCYTCDVFNICNGGCHMQHWDGTHCPAPKTLYRELAGLLP